MALESEFDILGLFRGVGLPQGGAAPFTGQLPNQVWLYRRPILDYWAETEDGETLGEIITHVLVHEIGHHFGFSDDDMEALEEQANSE
jgi:predicted Zn-dependent protease with MMP-like domain